MTHQHTAYVPSVNEFVLLRQAFTNVVAQVVAVNHAACKAEVAYLIPGDRDTTREIRKIVAFKMLMAYDVPGAVSHD